GATGVLVGGVAVTSFEVVNDSTIVAVTPAGTGIVDITVIGSASCGDGTLADRFRYEPAAAGGATTPPKPAEIARTGFEPLPSILVALGALIAGALALMIVRRRRSEG
ncbi:MAG TPA: LPXTG cell wall anchor domain-containing protein, partial [Agromyces sp.]|nr:LPXTG cell wall anchor domain-containing protein [Agromyces sp.]